jgi:hypothetical protein
MGITQNYMLLEQAMAFSNWFPIRPIGQMMAVSLLVSVSSHARPTEKKQKTSITTPESKNTTKSAHEDKEEQPLLGMYTATAKGVAKLYIKDKTIDHTTQIIFLTTYGNIGFVNDIKPTPIPIATNEQSCNMDNSVPGEFYDALGDQSSSIYCGTIDQKQNTHAMASIGLLLRTGSEVVKIESGRNVLIKYKNNFYTIDHPLTHECLHAKCINKKTNKTLVHFYYYLGYSTN